MGLFNIDPGLGIWTWILFGILFFILSKFGLPPLLKGIKTREESIAKSVDDAQAITKKLSDIDSEYSATLAKANAQASEIVRLAREEAQELRKIILVKADEEARLILEQAEEKSHEQRQVILESLRNDIAIMVCDGSEKIIGRSFLNEADKEWAKELVKTL